MSHWIDLCSLCKWASGSRCSFSLFMFYHIRQRWRASFDDGLSLLTLLWYIKAVPLATIWMDLKHILNLQLTHSQFSQLFVFFPKQYMWRVYSGAVRSDCKVVLVTMAMLTYWCITGKGGNLWKKSAVFVFQEKRWAMGFSGVSI